MRLKTLFFPAMLVVSFLIGIVYIWPEIAIIGSIKNDKDAKVMQLNDINSKKSLIGIAGEKITASDSIKIIKEYLPESKVEERIISNISYLASDANVALLDISLTDGAKKFDAVTEVDPATGLPLVAPQAAVQSTTAKISVAGNYQQIRIFLDGIQRLPIYNVIESVSIGKRESAKATDGSEASSPDSLLIDMSVNFGYMAISKITGATASSFSPNIDESALAALKGYYSSKNQTATSSTGFVAEKGARTNPFLAK